jgi:hypothetical protein
LAWPYFSALLLFFHRLKHAVVAVAAMAAAVGGAMAEVDLVVAMVVAEAITVVEAMGAAASITAVAEATAAVAKSITAVVEATTAAVASITAGSIITMVAAGVIIMVAMEPITTLPTTPRIMATTIVRGSTGRP